MNTANYPTERIATKHLPEPGTVVAQRVYSENPEHTGRCAPLRVQVEDARAMQVCDDTWGMWVAGVVVDPVPDRKLPGPTHVAGDRVCFVLDPAV